MGDLHNRETEILTEEGLQLHYQIEQALVSIFKEYIDRGNNIYEIEVIATGAVLDIACRHRLEKQAKISKTRRKQTV
jgi:hypothetical protein